MTDLSPISVPADFCDFVAARYGVSPVSMHAVVVDGLLTAFRAEAFGGKDHATVVAECVAARPARAEAARVADIHAAFAARLDGVVRGKRSRLVSQAVRGHAEALTRNAELDDWDTALCDVRDAAVAGAIAAPWPAPPAGLDEFMAVY